MPASRDRRGTGHLYGEIARFMTVGVVATAISVLGFNALVHGVAIGTAPLGGQPVVAFVLVNVVAGLVAYVGMRGWAFGHREVQRPVRSLVRFFALGALTMAIPVVCLAVSRYVLHRSDVWADNLSGNVLGLGLGTWMRFWLFRRYVFIEAAQPLTGGSGAGAEWSPRVAG